MKPKTIYKALHPEVTIIDAQKGIVEYVASDQSVDSSGEIVMVSGWKFDRFRKNAPFLNSHQGWDITALLGKVLSADVVAGQLVERVQWAVDVPDNDMARLGFQMTEAGYLKAVSVGFLPLEVITRKDAGWAAALSALNLPSEDTDVAEKIYLSQEQTELSSVVVGCNANALAKAYESGVVSEELMARVGFGGDAEMDFLTKAASAMDHPLADEVFKSIIGLEMTRIYAARPSTQTKSFKNKNQHQPDSQADKLAGARAVQRRAACRIKFLDQLDSLTK